jgi:hypothetical protein
MPAKLSHSGRCFEKIPALLKSSNQIPHIAVFLGTNRKYGDFGNDFNSAKIPKKSVDKLKKNI